MENISLLESKPENPKLEIKRKIFFCVFTLTVFVAFFNFLFLSAPIDFPIGSSVKIESGMSLRGVSLKLKEENIIRSRLVLEALIIILGGEKKIISANYYFENKLSVFEIAKRITRGEHYMAPISVTIPEGFNVEQTGDVFDEKLADFNKSEFLLQAKSLEGYLFPDTYFFLTTDNEKEVIRLMSENFEKKIDPLLSEITASGKSEKEIIVMASIIEKESKGDADRNLISGILWKRISINMPLQVDAAPDTYKTKGLPSSPICNAGLESIKAAIHPQSTSYLYYLHDKEGNTHYAKSFAEHVKNKLKYLR